MKGKMEKEVLLMPIGLEQNFIFHITSIKNLPAIVEAGGLFSDLALEKQSKCNINIAHSNIKERRRKTPVPIGLGGFVANYVPFYFCFRSPMLYTIHRGNVSGYEEGQKRVIHLCAKLADVIKNTNLNWCFSSGHTDILGLCDFYNDIKDFSKLDWDAIKSNGWGSPFTIDSDLKRRKQAEFLVHNFFPWHLFAGIGVFDNEIKEEVELCLQGVNPQLEVKTCPSWYY